MRTLFLGLALVCIFGIHYSDAYQDRGSWKKDLHSKAIFFEKNAQERHNILGSYPSSVQLTPPEFYAGSQQDAWKQLIETGELPPGWSVDHGTTGYSNVAHTSSWTGCYLTAEAFRVAFLHKTLGENSPEFRAAYDRADEIISSIRTLTLVSGQPGFLARGIALGHGISYEERGGASTRDLWAQGMGQFAHLRYRGGPSHHNYDHVFRGLGIYYFVAADERQKTAIREVVADMSNWAHLAHDMMVMHADGKRQSTVLIGGWRGLEGTDAPSGGSLMATTGLKITYAITGNEKVGRLYDKWVDKLGYRDPNKTKDSIMGPPRDNYDDTDHLLGDLYLLNLIEKDPGLRAFYKKCVEDSWKAHKDDKISWFNFVYRAVLGDEYGDPDGSLWNLQTYPTCRIFQPRMNSVRTDLEFITREGVKESLRPLPMYEQPSDNEYDWKSSPYRLDAWTSRIVSVLEISPHDPYIQFAADTSGYSYWSNTQGEIWHKMSGLPRVNDFLFSPDYPWIAFAATDGGVYRTLDGGRSWRQTLAVRVDRLQLNPRNTHILYGVGNGGIYKSEDLGERDIASVWHSISGDPVPGGAAYAVDLRPEKAILYRLTRERLYWKEEGAPEWNASARIVRTHDFGDVDPIGGQPLWLRVDESVAGRLFHAVSIQSEEFSGSLISVSDDGGTKWSPIVREAKPMADWADSTGKVVNLFFKDLEWMAARLKAFPISDVRSDRSDPNTWYGLLESGVAVTHDAGKTWKTSREGLDIPRVRTLWIPRHSNEIYVGTPAGMYVSRNRGESWQDTSLILQGDGAIRSEIGGMGYLEAYWMGRYHGFLTDEQAHAQWWESGK